MKQFKTSRQMRQGASLVKQFFLVYRKGHKCHLDWGRTTPSSIRRWMRVVEARQKEYDRTHRQEIAHLRPQLLRWFEAVGKEGMERLVAEWPHLRGDSDLERATATASRNLKRLEKKHPLFAAMGALDEVAVIPTPEGTLSNLRAHWEKFRDIKATRVSPLQKASQADPDKMTDDDRMSRNQLLVWGRVSLGWPPDTQRVFSEPAYAQEMAKREVDRPHKVLAREVLLVNARDEQHAREIIGGIFYSVHAHGIENGIIGAPALRALRDIACEVLGGDAWLFEYVERGRTRRLKRLAEKEAARAARAAQWAPRAEQLLIPLEVAS